MTRKNLPIHSILILLIILFSSLRAYSQDNLNTFVGQKIYSINAVSTSGITESDIERECGLRKGEIFSIPAVRACIVSFYQKGLFQDILVEASEEGDGVRVQYTFVEKIRVGNIRIKGHDYFSARRLKSAAGLKRGNDLSKDGIAGARNRILDLYKGAGFFDASVEVEGMPEGKNQEAEIRIMIDEGKRAKAADIIFQGNMIRPAEELASLMKLHKGDYYSEREMDQSIQALERHYIDKGYLKILISPPELVYDEAKGEVLLTLSIEAGPHVDVLFEGAETMAPEALKKELLIWKEKAFDSSVLDESADRLTQFYRNKGYYFAAVTYRIDQSDDRNLKIVFQITEGIPVTVREVGFSGNHYFSTKVLKEYLDIKKGKFLIEDVLKEDIKEMTALYKNSGFLEVKLAQDILFHEEDKTLGIRITVEEGIQTFLTRMEVSGNNTFSREEIMGHSKSREGHPYNESQVIDDLYSIQSFYVQKGYLYASVDLKSRYSPDKKEVMIDYIITEDKPVYIGETYVSGHSVTREYVIRRELLIKEGDLYSYENILRSQRRLLSLGIFKGIKLEPMNPEVREYRKDMSLKVEEGYPGTVEFGIGYGDVEKMRGMFEASYRNLFGTGRQTTLRVEGSSIEQKYSLGYKEPWVLGYPMDARINMVDQIENKRSFDRRTLGLSTGIDKSFSDYVKGSLMYQYEDIRLSDVSAEAILTPEDTGKVGVATINPSMTIDFRDDPFNPSRGTFSSIALREAARLIGSRPQFAKVNLQASLFYPPVKRVVVAFSARGGIAWNFGESKEVPIFERYFTGGRSTVRGYDQERLGIPGKTILFDGTNWSPTGGNMMVVFNGEIRFPLYKGLGMVAFVDSGNVWRKMEEFEMSEIRSTAGAGIRYDTPVGPLRLDVGCKLDREVGEEQCLTHFTLGHAF